MKSKELQSKRLESLKDSLVLDRYLQGREERFDYLVKKFTRVYDGKLHLSSICGIDVDRFNLIQYSLIEKITGRANYGSYELQKKAQADFQEYCHKHGLTVREFWHSSHYSGSF